MSAEVKIRTAFAVTMLVCSISPAIGRAQQSPSRLHARRNKQQIRKPGPPHTTAAPAPPSEQALPPPPVLAVYEEGVLSISAEDVTLGEILDSVQASTGAVVDAPAIEERISVHLGPQPPVQVIAALLEGTHLNYAILGGTGPTDRIQRIIVMPKVSAGPPPPNPISQEVAARARARAETQRAQIGGGEGVWDNHEVEPPASVLPQRAREHK